MGWVKCGKEVVCDLRVVDCFNALTKVTSKAMPFE